ncbi:MAG: hypothetical protein HN826_09340 [Methylococcales bacterium]|jgi:hypothetical protein|nr:hypothetical protein [Methylococcales bacterium]
MEKIFGLVILLLIATASFAEKLEDVEVLNSKQSKNGITLKLQAIKEGKESFFYVDVTKDDRNSFEKLHFVIQKLKNGAKFKLNLNIKSFSFFPSGSYYRSQSVGFSGNVKVRGCATNKHPTCLYFCPPFLLQK